MIFCILASSGTTLARHSFEPFHKTIVMPSGSDGKLSHLRPSLLVDRRNHSG